MRIERSGAGFSSRKGDNRHLRLERGCVTAGGGVGAPGKTD